MKKFSVVSVIVCGAMILSFSASGCKKAEQPAEAPKPAAQAESSAIEGFKVNDGTIEKGGLGVILSSEKDKAASAMKKLDTPFRNAMTVKGQMKSAVPSGTRNGFIIFAGTSADKKSQSAKAGILMGRMVYTIDGPLVAEVEKQDKFDQGKVFDYELTVNLKDKSVSLTVDGKKIATKMTSAPVSITHVGFVVSNTKTEFSDPQITGE